MMKSLVSSPDVRNFVVTGCGRSGTTYTARLLASLGYRCGHEELFGPFQRKAPHFRSRHGDVSWLAVPFLDQLPPGTAVVHQVRHPVQVIRSLAGIGLFGPPQSPKLRQRIASALERLRVRFPATVGRFRTLERLATPHSSDFVAFIARHAPEVLGESDELSRCMRYWVSWNRRTETAANEAGLEYRLVRVEGLDRRALHTLVDFLGSPRQTIPWEYLDTLPRTINTRRRREDLNLASLPDGSLRRELAEMAQKYGYSL